MLKTNEFKENNISVEEYCLKKTKVGDQVEIYNSGYYAQSCIIDSEDLFARYLNSRISITYVDSVDIFDRIITDVDSTGTSKTKICKCHVINIGHSIIDFDTFRIRMDTPAGIIYTKWFKVNNKAADIDEERRQTAKRAYEESDKMLTGCHSWSRKLEYFRKFEKE